MAKLNRILFLPRIMIQDVYSIERRLSSMVIQGLRILQSVAPVNLYSFTIVCSVQKSKELESLNRDPLLKA